MTFLQIFLDFQQDDAFFSLRKNSVLSFFPGWTMASHFDLLLLRKAKEIICVWGYMLKKIGQVRRVFLFIVVFFYTKSIWNTEAKSCQV